MVSGVYTRCTRPFTSSGWIRTERIGSKSARGITLGKDVSIDTLHVSIDTCLTSGTPLTVRCVVRHMCCVDRHITRTQRRFDKHVLCRSTWVYNHVCRSTHACCVRSTPWGSKAWNERLGVRVLGLTPAVVGSVRDFDPSLVIS